jgi:hypothetical protein
MGNLNDDSSHAYLCYKVYLCGADAAFRGVTHPWNRSYGKAAAIFRNPLVLAGVRSAHVALYSTHLGSARMGVLRDEAAFFSLFNHGLRDGRRRFFTYVLGADCLRCSETGEPHARTGRSASVSVDQNGGEWAVCFSLE